ncbi:MAG: HEPN domain-containing protein [Solirubrobacteraceae bacterium]
MPEADASREAGRWLARGEADLRLSRAGLEQRTLFEPWQVCFHAQQAAEKAIKALLVLDQTRFPFTHDLPALAALLDARPKADDALPWLSLWAAAARYPGEAEPAWADAERAVTIARDVVADARARLPTP